MSTPKTRSTGAARWATPVVATCLLVAITGSATATDTASPAPSATLPAPEPGAPAAWTPKEVHYVYQGFTTKYSCDGLRDKIKSVLLQLGARKKDLEVREDACSSSFGRPDPFPGVRVKMSVLQPATSGDDKQAPLPTHWKPVDLTMDDFPHESASGNCELLEQINRTFVPLFTTRNVQFQSNCIPHQATIGSGLKLEVLAPDRPERGPGKPVSN